MTGDLSGLLREVDRSFVPLGERDVYNSDGAHVVVPPRVEELGLLVPPVKVHLGRTRAEYEYLKEEEQGAEPETGDEPEVAVGEAMDAEVWTTPGLKREPTIPYLVVSKYDKWMREKAEFLQHFKMQRLKENRALTLGVYFVPETSSRSTVAAAPKPHQIAVGEMLSFWVRPWEWREYQFLYILREQFGRPLLAVFEQPVEQILEQTVAEKGDDAKVGEDGESTAEDSEDDDRPVSDGGRLDPDQFSEAEIAAFAPIIEEVEVPSFELVEKWRDHGYYVDREHRRLINQKLVNDLLGVSDQVRQLRQVLAADYDWEDAAVDETRVLTAVFRVFVSDHEDATYDLRRSISGTLEDGAVATEIPEQEEPELDAPVTFDYANFHSAVMAELDWDNTPPEHARLAGVLDRYVLPLLTEESIITQTPALRGSTPLQTPIPPGKNKIGLTVRPTAVYAALDQYHTE
ncbi:hypothetical protein QA600_18490 [Natronococcus sp. A-GB1]|uniref:hypothetical protein n=1 Tax=Natronococcus sp. A-GB1 TaxID=3037648 RepID=UPI00241CACD6|nr:hypothetical protein [Natronococcus sp. A-GB1]MDG5761322.1 hypothetical protein [Natronococcus sp. A-GB1]